MKGKCHQVNCSLRVQYHDTTRLKPDLKVARQIDMMDQGRVKKGQKGSRSTYLDFSSAQPNRPANFLAHGGCRKAGLKIETFR
jgi:hypothetical protein